MFNSMISGFAEASLFLQQRLPFFQHAGSAAYRPGLDKIRLMLHALGNPHLEFKTIHIGGTNGKGSSAHMTAAVLQTAGYQTALFTSPHLKSVTERFRINGAPMPDDVFVKWVNRLLPLFDELEPTYFEATFAMACGYFHEAGAEVAVIEVGLGGRLDATNIVEPLACLITNIGHDHLDILGPGLDNVAAEKAGIIKHAVPVVIGEHLGELDQIFKSAAVNCQSPVCFAEDMVELEEIRSKNRNISFRILTSEGSFSVSPDLQGSYQQKNIRSVVALLGLLRQQGLIIQNDHIISGLSQAAILTGLKGRWQKLGDNPMIICDTAHNPEGMAGVVVQARSVNTGTLRWVLGLVADKDPEMLLRMLPIEACYYFCEAHSPRAMKADVLASKAISFGLKGIIIDDVNDALSKAVSDAAPDDLILICGSNYIIAELRNL